MSKSSLANSASIFLNRPGHMDYIKGALMRWSGRCHSPRALSAEVLFFPSSCGLSPLTGLRLRASPARPPLTLLSPEGPAVVVVSLQGALVTHALPSGVAPAETTEGLGVSGLSCPRDAAAPKVVADSCGKEAEGGQSATQRQTPCPVRWRGLRPLRLEGTWLDLSAFSLSKTGELGLICWSQTGAAKVWTLGSDCYSKMAQGNKMFTPKQPRRSTIN